MKKPGGGRLLKLIDLSHPIENNMPVYPGDERPRVEQIKWLASDYHNNHRLATAMHVGTHVDAPSHMLGRGQTISELPITAFVGRGVLLDVRGEEEVEWKPAYEEKIPSDSIVVLYTGHSKYYRQTEYFTNHPTVTLDFAEHLISKKIKMLGMDLPSPDLPPFPVHKKLLANGIYILENLTNLAALGGHLNFMMIALPLKLHTDGSPVRAVAFDYEHG